MADGTPEPAGGTTTGEWPWLAAYPDGIDWAAEIPRRTLVDLFDEAVSNYGDRWAVEFLGRRTRYAELGAQVDALAAGLAAEGIGPGSRVGLFLPNCPLFIAAYYAVLKAGATVVNFNPLYAVREVASQIADSGIAMMVTLDLQLLYDKLAPSLESGTLRKLVVGGMADMLPWPKSWLFPMVRARDIAKMPRDDRHLPLRRLMASGGHPPEVTVDPGQTAVIQYTGGTTGTPKGAMLSHANLYANTLQAAWWLGTGARDDDRMLGVLPFFHVFAMTVVMNFSIHLGMEIIALPRFELGTVMKTIHGKKPTLFPAVPTLYAAIANHPHRAQYDLSSIRTCVSGGAPLPIEIKQRFESVTGCTVVEGYGLTEASPITHCNPVEGVNKTGSIGLPLPGTVAEIVSLDDHETRCPRGERGELVISGPQVMQGYWNRPEDTDLVLRDGRLHTGDVGFMDEDGYVFIVDRIKDLIICSGYNVYPRNVEEAIYQHPAVEECIVAGIPDAYRGETVKAFIKLRAGHALTGAELGAFLEDRLSPMEMPKLVEFRDTPLPKTMVGKLSRKAILEEEEEAARAEEGDR